MSQGKLDDAEKQIGAALPMLEAAEPPDSLATARARSDFAQVLFWKGQAEPAIANERRVYETYRRVLGADNAQTAMHLRNLGVLLDEVDRVDEAEKAYRESQAILVKRLGPDHVNLGYSYVNLASLLDIRRGQSVEAEELYKRTLEIRRKALGNNHPTVGQALQLTGLFYLNQGRLDESEATYGEALALFRGINPKHFEVGKCLNGLALVASRRGRYAEAEQRLDEVIAALRRGARAEAPVLVAGTGQPRGADRAAGATGGGRRDPARGRGEARGASTVPTAARPSRRARAWERRCASGARPPKPRRCTAARSRSTRSSSGSRTRRWP